MTKAVTAAGIPLVCVDLGPNLGSKLPPKVSVVVSDHTVSGRQEMEGLANCMHGRGDLGILLGELASNATQQRTDGNEEAIAKHPEIKVVEEQTADHNRNRAVDFVRNGPTKGGGFAGTAANDDEMAIGAIFALQQAGQDPEKMCTGGIDAPEDSLDQVKKGNLAVTVFQDAKGQGRAALDAAVRLIKGEGVPPFVLILYELVTPQNMKDFANR